MGKRIISTAGETRHRMTLLRELEPAVRHADGKTLKTRRALFECACGRTVERAFLPWHHGTTKSCGCLNRESRREAQAIKVEPGDAFGWLTVVREIAPRQHPGGQAHRAFLFACACGGGAEAGLGDVRSGNTASCGCLRANRHDEEFTGKGRPIAGAAERMIHKGMVGRAMSPDHPDFPRYGGAGRGVAEEWLDFERFYADMGPRPTPEHSLDRIDNRTGYGPGLCRWATPAEQMENKPDSRWWLTPLGRFPSARKASEAHHVSVHSIRHRCGLLSVAAWDGYGTELKYSSEVAT